MSRNRLQRAPSCSLELTDEGILRGTSRSVVLGCFGRNIRESAGGIGIASAEDLYRHSFLVKRLDFFLSHSWSAHWLPKFLTLLLYFNTVPAIIFTLLAGFGIAFVFHHPEENLSQDIRKVYFICLPLGVLVFFVVLLSWHHITHKFGILDKSIFLDKVCIHQTDAIRKANGIRSLGGILNHTNHLIVAWDATYFDRLWCTFELAAFMYGHKQGHIVVLPTMLGWVMSVFVLLSLSAGVGRVIAIKTTQINLFGFDQLTSFRLLFAMGLSLQMMFFANVVRKYAREVADLNWQLSDFSVKNAKCFCCSHGHVVKADGEMRFLPCDRLLVETSIRDWYGIAPDRPSFGIARNDRKRHTIEQTFSMGLVGLESFDYLVRTQLREDIRSSFGGLSKLPYTFTLAVGIWNTLTFLDLSEMLGCTPLNKIALVLSKCFTLEPTTIAIASLLCQFSPQPADATRSCGAECLVFIRSRLVEVCISVALCIGDFAHSSMIDAALTSGTWRAFAAIVFDVALTVTLYHTNGDKFLRKTIELLTCAGSGAGKQLPEEIEMQKYPTESGNNSIRHPKVDPVTEESQEEFRFGVSRSSSERSLSSSSFSDD